MAFQLYPEDEMRLRTRIRSILLDHIKTQGGAFAGGVESKRQAKKGAKKERETMMIQHLLGQGYEIGGAMAGGKRKRKKRKGGVIAGGVESKRQRKRGAKHNPWIAYVKKNKHSGLSLKQLAKQYHAKKR